MYKKILNFSLVLLSIYGIYKIGAQIIIQNQNPVLVWSKNLINSDSCQINVYSKQPINQKANFVIKINQTLLKRRADWNFSSKYEFNFKTAMCLENQKWIQTNIKYQAITFWNYLFFKMIKIG